jgi:predicted acylesterase/phospholipase RssA
LAFEGGGTKGAFQAGAFKAVAELLDPKEVQYDVIAGVSVGSVNGMLLAATPIGKEKEAARKLSRLWATIEFKDVIAEYSYWDIIRGFFDKRSFFDNTPFLKYLTDNLESLGDKLHRKYTIGAVDAYIAKTIIINETVGTQEIPKSVVASAAIPGLFPYSLHQNKTLIDGGTIDNVNIRGGIEQCRQIVDDDSLITIDVIMTNPINTHTTMNMSKQKSYTIYERAKQVAAESNNFWYLNDAITAFPNANWRYLIAPKEALPNYPIIALSFDRETLKKEEEIGYNVTKGLLISNRAKFKEVMARAPRVKRRRIY